jgi:bacterioferritin
MSVDPRTLGWLKRALTHETRAVQQYLAQSALTRLWGDVGLSDSLRREAVEELKHAERLMERLIELGIAPSAGNLLPARLGRNVDELLLANHELEVEAVRLYQEAHVHAQRMRDTANADLFADILAEELQHLQDLDHLRSEHVRNA